MTSLVESSTYVSSFDERHKEDNQKQVHRLRVLALANEFLAIQSDEPVRSLRITQLLSTINQMCRIYHTRFGSLELHTEIIEKLSGCCSRDIRLLSIKV